MSTSTLLISIAIALVLAGATGGACAWWYKRRVAALRDKLDRSRQSAGAYIQQARRQIAQLQQEMQGQQGLRDELSHWQARAAELESKLQRRDVLDSVDAGDDAMAAAAAGGFASTQPMRKRAARS